MRPTIEEIAMKLGCSPEQVRAQFALNAKQLRTMAAKAEANGHKVNGFSATELKAMADSAATR